MSNTIIDHIEGISVDFDNAPIPNVFIMNSLGNGVVRLAQQLRSLEIDKYQDTKKHKDVFELSANIDPMIPNYHHWFVLNITNYARCVALIDIMLKEKLETKDLIAHSSVISKHCSKYVRESIPIMHGWRNKIVAHPSATDPRKDDNVATLQLSMMHMISYNMPYYYMGRSKLVIENMKTPLEGWSLTRLFEDEIAPRYWPHIQLKRIQHISFK